MSSKLISKKWVSRLLYWLYRKKYGQRKLILKVVSHLEGGDLFSETLRRIFKDYHEIKIGKYSHGGCFNTVNIDKFTRFGNYCSIARSVRIFNRNHPMDFISSHAFFFNPILKYCEKDVMTYQPLEMGHDVWMGHNSIILPVVSKIGTGAVIGAGAVVNKNLPPYAIAVGNPARIVRYRFSNEEIGALMESRWWEKSIEQIRPNIAEFQRSLKL